MSRKTRRDLRDAKREYKEAKSDLKTTKNSYKQAEKREARLLNPKTDAEKRYLGQKQKARRTVASKEIEALKERKKTAKAKKRQAIQRNGGTKAQKLGRVTHHQASHFVDSAFQDNDVLEDIASARQTIRRTHAEVRQAKKLGNYTVKIGKGATRVVYGAGNRTYNLVRGRSFTRTPVANRWETKVTNKYQRLRAKLRTSKAGKTASATKKVAVKVGKPILAVLKNPLSAKAYLIMFLGVLIIALLGVVTGGGSSTVAQNEFDLTEAWTHISKIDREKSTDKVDYWTNIDEIMMFMGYKYEDYKLDSPYNTDKKWWELNHSYRELLSDTWEELNKDKDNLKTMSDIYTSSENKYLRLSESELKEYNEVLEQAKQVGYYVTYNDLSNPFNAEANDEKLDPIRIDKRFGYVSKTEIYNGSVLQANQGSKLYAVMDGTISVKEQDVIISSETAEFTYKNVTRVRVNDGDKIKVGNEIGEVSDVGGQEVYYRKLKNKKKKEWVWVNVGFYLPKVEYNQTTSVISDMNLDGDIGKKINDIYNFFKKQDSSVTLNGISAILGNFWTESSITAKRAEGDYLSPPVGASANSWDDPNWLNMGNAEVYQGKYPNIIHRGIGLGQWTDTRDGSIRHTMLLNYAKDKGKKWYDLELQLDFMLNGDSPYYIEHLKNILHSSEDVDYLTNKFLVYWEGNEGDKVKERQHNAQQVLSYLKNPRGHTRGGSSVLESSWGFPSEYSSKISSYPSGATVSASLDGNTYPIGQCTWYVYNRLVEAGAPHYNWLGDGQNWVRGLVARGWKYSSTPVAGAVMSIQGGFWNTPEEYGHVSYVEHVNEDGSFLVSECNIQGVQDRIHWTLWTNQSYLSFAIPPK